MARDRTPQFFELVAKHVDSNSTKANNSVAFGGAIPSIARPKNVPANKNLDQTTAFRNSVSGGGPRSPEAAAQLAEFSSTAQRVETVMKRIVLEIAKLKELAKVRTLFDDRTAEVQQKTHELKQDLTAVSKDMDSLDRIVNTRQLGYLNSDDDASAHHRAIVTTFRTNFLSVSREFREALEIRTRTLQQQELRRRVYQPVAPSQTIDAPQAGRATASSFDDDSFPQGGADQDLESGLKMYAQPAQQHQSSYHQSRVDAVEQVQKVLGELASVFQRVATLVGQQEEMVMRIDNQVDDSLHNLNEGQTQLLRYLQTISSNRTMILKVFGILMAFAVFFIVFLA